MDIIGAIIIILDRNLQVLGYWNAFDHDCLDSTCLDINRPGVGGETCTTNSKGGTISGCPPILLSSPANDWLHANSLQYLTPDGDLLLSLRDQNWVAKIDYNNGAGTNGILWRLGVDGDFQILNSGGNQYPWFSTQHDAGFVGSVEQTLTVFDNGVTRHSYYGGNSRGQVYTIDQTHMTATLQLNVDLGVYSPSLGSAQLLMNGDYMFQPGNISAGSTTEVQSTEVTTGASIVYQFQSLGSTSYRGWRLTDFYHAPLNGSAGPQ